MGKRGVEKGELVLLGVFALFVIMFLWDIRTLPVEGKMLSYLAAPFILVATLLCVRGVFAAAKRNAAENGGGAEADVKEHGSAAWRFYLTIGAGLFMFGGIYLIGFYLGSGLMMLVWFAAFRKLNAGSIALSIGLPLLLYLTFEKLLEMGLPAGQLFGWLGI
ncbi:MAG: tripartite tricarboxylate transporter TctB family protein [Deltaproteobacteria bacterium]|nr:tripartite tricarboxylate transporter TctB family protein [Deltaproteobacteria bacterium]